jgi:hypothetical protein
MVKGSPRFVPNLLADPELHLQPLGVVLKALCLDFIGVVGIARNLAKNCTA